MRSVFGVVALSLATADPLACKPNAEQPMLPIYHSTGDVTKNPDEFKNLRNGSLAAERGIALKANAMYKIKGTGSGAASSSDVAVTFSGLAGSYAASFGACVLGNATMEGLGIAITVSTSVLGRFANIQVGTCGDTMYKQNPLTPPGYKKWERYWDLLGGDYEVNTSSFLTGNCTTDSCACQARCQADGPEKCKSWTLVPGLRCCLKDRVPPARPSNEGLIFSGVENADAIPSYVWPAYEKWETDWDLLGGDYEINTSSVLTGECTTESCACQARCQADGPEKCKSWTLVPGQRCCLKGSVPYAQRDAGVISGVEDPDAKPSSASVWLLQEDSLTFRITPDRSLADFFVRDDDFARDGKWIGTMAWPINSFAPRKPADSQVALWSSSNGVKADIQVYSMDCGSANAEPII